MTKKEPWQMTQDVFVESKSIEIERAGFKLGPREAANYRDDHLFEVKQALSGASVIIRKLLIELFNHISGGFHYNLLVLPLIHELDRHNANPVVSNADEHQEFSPTSPYQIPVWVDVQGYAFPIAIPNRLFELLYEGFSDLDSFVNQDCLPFYAPMDKFCVFRMRSPRFRLMAFYKSGFLFKQFLGLRYKLLWFEFHQLLCLGFSNLALWIMIAGNSYIVPEIVSAIKAPFYLNFTPFSCSNACHKFVFGFHSLYFLFYFYSYFAPVIVVCQAGDRWTIKTINKEGVPRKWVR